MLKHILTVLGFVAVTFTVQGLNHFVINKSHYESIEFARPEPVLALGFITMIIQGLIMSFAMLKLARPRASIADGFLVSLSFGVFLGSYIALAEPAKYAAPSILSWFLTEGLVSTIQFLLFGLVLGLIHSKLSVKESV